MKLLSKQQTAINTSLVRKQQIDEGVSIAKKIDKMREEMLSLQKQRNDFIVGTKQEIDIQTGKMQERLEALKQEIKILEEAREKLKEPLDKEWMQVREERFTLEREKTEFKISQTKLEQKEFDISNKESDLTANLNKQKLLLEETEKNAEKSRRDKSESEVILIDAKNKVENTNKEIETRLNALIEKEKLYEFNKKGLEQIAKNNDTKEQELNDRERAVNDKYNQLLKTKEDVRHTNR